MKCGQGQYEGKREDWSKEEGAASESCCSFLDVSFGFRIALTSSLAVNLSPF